jgi:hypothetical protein
VSLELGAFSKAMDGFQKALAAAQAHNDNTLLLQVYKLFFLYKYLTADMTQWSECSPIAQKVAGSISAQYKHCVHEHVCLLGLGVFYV